MQRNIGKSGSRPLYTQKQPQPWPPKTTATDAIINSTVAEAVSADASANAPLILPPPLHQCDCRHSSEIFQDEEHFPRHENNLGSKRIQCLWCTKDLPGKIRKVLHHICCKGNGVAPCNAVIPPSIHKQRYLDLLHRKEGRKNLKADELFFYMLAADS